ncbi:ODA1 [Symbiodinium microadriaticum]|nr:ODA1 [Symbiodinium microadriaticum]
MTTPLALTDGIQSPRGVTNTVSVATASGVGNFLRDLDKLQEQQIFFAKKVDKQKRVKQKYEEELEELKGEVLALRAATRSGDLKKEEEQNFKKTIARIEKSVQMARIKYSVIHSENTDTRKHIDDTRKDKILYLQIKTNLERDIGDLKRKIQDTHREVTAVNDAKQRAKNEKKNIKNKMLSDMEEFARELHVAKENISATQEVIIGTIREKMESTFATWEGSFKHSRTGSRSVGHRSISQRPGDRSTYLEGEDGDDDEQRCVAVGRLLEATGMESVDSVMAELQTSEEYIFSMYKNIQNSSLELEKLETENKALEAQVEEQVATLESIEGHNDQVREELEQHIASIQKSITAYETSYNGNVQVLGTISESLMSILRNVASDEDAVDQQLLSSGLNDRNIETYLGVVEQRVDYLIQMSRAALRETFQGSDFVTLSTSERRPGGGMTALNLPTLETADDHDDDADDNARVTPINIGLLKDFMQKRVQKGMLRLDKGRNVESM